MPTKWKRKIYELPLQFEKFSDNPLDKENSDIALMTKGIEGLIQKDQLDKFLEPLKEREKKKESEEPEDKEESEEVKESAPAEINEFGLLDIKWGDWKEEPRAENGAPISSRTCTILIKIASNKAFHFKVVPGSKEKPPKYVFTNLLRDAICLRVKATGIVKIHQAYQTWEIRELPPKKKKADNGPETQPAVADIVASEQQPAGEHPAAPDQRVLPENKDSPAVGGPGRDASEAPQDNGGVPAARAAKRRVSFDDQVIADHPDEPAHDPKRAKTISISGPPASNVTPARPAPQIVVHPDALRRDPPPASSGDMPSSVSQSTGDQERVAQSAPQVPAVKKGWTPGVLEVVTLVAGGTLLGKVLSDIRSQLKQQ